MMANSDDMGQSASRRQLSLLDAMCIVVGIIIGASIFRAPQLVAAGTGGPGLYFLAWALGGAISLLGSLCFAELATRYPDHGGAYVYLKRAFGDRASFLYAWTEFWLVRPGNVGAMALVFAPAFCSALGREWNQLYVAVGIVIAVTLLNLLGLRFGVWGQNVFTFAKVLGLTLVVAIGLGAAFAAWFAPEAPQSLTSVAADAGASPLVNASATERFAAFLQAMVFVMFAYGGWSDMAMVSAEVRDPKRNLFRALLLGAAAVTVIYLLVNLAYFARLGFGGIQSSASPAQDVIASVFGSSAGRVMSAIVCISCLGAIQGLIFTGARVQYALGRDHRLFTWLGAWHARSQTPIRALLAQCVAAALLLLAAWFSAGRDTNGTGDAFDQMVVYTGVVYWSSLLGVAAAFLVLRDRTDAPRAFETPWFPVVALLFIVTMGAMVYATVRYAFFVKLENGEGIGWFVMALVVFSTGILLGGHARALKNS